MRGLGYQPQRAESFDVEFNEWADQEMLTHGQDISFRDWARDEGKKHGNVPITDWAEHEEESHDERYGAETFEARGLMGDDVVYCPNCPKQMREISPVSDPYNPEPKYRRPIYYCLHCGGREGIMTTAQIQHEMKDMKELNPNWKEVFPIEQFRAESKKTKYGMIAAGIITAFALLPEIKKRF